MPHNKTWQLNTIQVTCTGLNAQFVPSIWLTGLTSSSHTHSRNHHFSDEIVERVHHQFKLGRTGPLNDVLDINREEALIGADPQKIADYAVSHWADPTDAAAPDPVFFIALDGWQHPEVRMKGTYPGLGM